PVLDHDRVSHHARERLGEHARHQVESAAGWLRHDHADRALRIRLRVSLWGRNRDGGQGRGEQVRFHGTFMLIVGAWERRKRSTSGFHRGSPRVKRRWPSSPKGGSMASSALPPCARNASYQLLTYRGAK